MEEFFHHQLERAFEHLNGFYLLVAIALGALHAMEPGHGKALLSIYFVGRKRTLWDVLLLALIVTFTHTFSVIILAAAGLWLAHTLWHDRMMVGVGIVGGAGVVILGCVLWWRARRESHARHFHAEADQHHHDCGKAHGTRSMGELFWVGLVAGLVPCPAGVAILLVALTTGRVINGLIVTLAFSVGVGVLIFLVGLVMWRSFQWAEEFFAKRESLIMRLPQISSAIIILAGLLALGFSVREWLHPH